MSPPGDEIPAAAASGETGAAGSPESVAPPAAAEPGASAEPAGEPGAPAGAPDAPSVPEQFTKEHAHEMFSGMFTEFSGRMNTQMEEMRLMMIRGAQPQPQPTQPTDPERFIPTNFQETEQWDHRTWHEKLSAMESGYTDRLDKLTKIMEDGQRSVSDERTGSRIGTFIENEMSKIATELPYFKRDDGSLNERAMRIFKNEVMNTMGELKRRYGNNVSMIMNNLNLAAMAKALNDDHIGMVDARYKAKMAGASQPAVPARPAAAAPSVPAIPAPSGVREAHSSFRTFIANLGKGG